MCAVWNNAQTKGEICREIHWHLRQTHKAVAPNKASSGDGIIEQDALFLSHLAAVAKTVSAVQSYTDKFRLVHENRVTAKEMRRAY